MKNNLIICFVCLSIFFIPAVGALTKHKTVENVISKTTYKFSNEQIDVVIPCHKDDINSLDACINGIRENGRNIRRIIVVSSEKYSNKAEWFDEAKYPFSKESITKQIFKGARESHPQCGHVFQQLLKLYAPFVIPRISSNVLLLDADVIFLNPVNFINKQTDGGYFNFTQEFNLAYLAHAYRLVPGFKKVYERFSSDAHQMLVQRPILMDLFSIVEFDSKKDMWKAFCDCIDVKGIDYPCSSEYEIYFNFSLLRTNQCRLKTFKWSYGNLKNVNQYKKKGIHYIVCNNLC